MQRALSPGVLLAGRVVEGDPIAAAAAVAPHHTGDDQPAA